MNRPIQLRRHSMQNTMCSENPLRLTPNFKASFMSSQMEQSLDLGESDISWDPSQKSFDLVSHMSSKALANPLSRRSNSTKRMRQHNESALLDPTQMQIIPGSDSQRKSFRSQLSSQFSSKVASTKASDNLVTHPRSASFREKPVVAVPLVPVKKKLSEAPRNSIVSERGKESQRESIRVPEILPQQTSFDSEYPNIKIHHEPSPVMSYQNSMKFNDDLRIRNKQLEESLQLEILRGEEQRVYIEVLKKSIEDSTRKTDNQLTIEMEQNQRESQLRKECSKLYSEVSEMRNRIGSLKESENNLNKQNMSLKDKFTEAQMEKEMLENHVNHFQRNNETLGSEVKRLAEALFKTQQECLKLQQENKQYLSQLEDRTKENELEGMKQSYIDLQLLSEEIEKQRKVASKMLEEEMRLRRMVENEKESLADKLRLKEIDLRDKENQVNHLLKTVEERTRQKEEFQQKFEILEENYSILRITLNENETELEQLKKNIEDDTIEKQVRKNEVNNLQEENRRLKDQLTRLEDIHKLVQSDNERAKKELKTKDTELKTLTNSLQEAIDGKERILDEYKDADATLRQNENKEKVIKGLKDQINLLEKENSLLKSSTENSKWRTNEVESYREENSNLMKKNETFVKKLQDLGESQYSLKAQNENLSWQVENIKKEFKHLEKGLIEIMESNSIDDDFEESRKMLKDKKLLKAEWDSKRTQIILSGVKKEFEKMQERYTLAKSDLIKEMERCEEIQRQNSKDSSLRRENLALKQKIDELTEQLQEANKENILLKRSTENLSKKLSQTSSQVNILKGEFETIKNKENQSPSKLVQEMAVTSAEVKLRDAMIKRMNGLIFNSDAKELLDEIMHIEAKMIRLEKVKMKAPLRNSVSSFQTKDSSEKTGNNIFEMQSVTSFTINSDEIEEALELQKARKNTLEEELQKLGDQERTRYNSIGQIEKQNFELKNELSRLMNELEINYSEYRESKNDYFSRRMDDKFGFSNGHELTMSELVPHNHLDEEGVENRSQHEIINRILEANGDEHYYS